MMSSTLRRGFSDEIGSWKIIFMRVRVSRSSSPSSFVMSMPSKSTFPDFGARQLHDRLARGRLAAARLADEAERLARLHVEADVGDRVHLEPGAADRELDDEVLDPQQRLVFRPEMRGTRSRHQATTVVGGVTVPGRRRRRAGRWP